MFNKFLEIDKEIKDFNELDKVIKKSRIYDGGLEILLGISTQEELDRSSPWVSYEDGKTCFYEDSAEDDCQKTEYIHVPMNTEETTMAKKDYKVTIRETLEKEIDVKAFSAAEAQMAVENAYRSGNIVLTADDFTEREINCREAEKVCKKIMQREEISCSRNHNIMGRER